MIELSADAIALLNEDATADTGENHAVLDRDGLEAAAARPWSGFGDVELFPTIFDKAGALLHALASRQIFENGNKRTAWLAAVALLDLNGVDIGHVPTIQADAFVRAVSVDHNFAEDDAAEWFRVTVELVMPVDLELRGGTRRIADLVDAAGHIVGLDADGVTFVGPAVLFQHPSTSFVDCGWDPGGGTPESIVWEIDHTVRSSVVGAVLLQECSFVRCTFVNIGYSGPPGAVEAFFGNTTL